MYVLNFSETRAKLKSVMDKVVRDHTPMLVSRKNGEAVVLVSLADWNVVVSAGVALIAALGATAPRKN